MTTSIPDTRLVIDLRAAADRLIAGTPLRSNGKLTISGLAIEAGIKRWILTHKHPELRQQYQAEFNNLGKVPAPIQAARDKASSLEKDLARLRADKQHLKSLVDTYACLIRDLTEQLTTTQQERDDARTEINHLQDGVAVLADRRPAT